VIILCSSYSRFDLYSSYSKFENLPEEKKKRILDACIEEFSQNSYENASTNNIVKKAGISKGLLFHYFGSKKNLFIYVYDYALEFFKEYIWEKLNKVISDSQTDFFERIMQTALIKMRLVNEYPAIYAVVINGLNVPNDLQKEIRRSYEKVYKEYVALVLKNMDMSNFRKDIDRNKAIEIILFALEGISDKYVKMFKNMPAHEIFSKMESFAAEYYEYIDILKGGVYGKGELPHRDVQ